MSEQRVRMRVEGMTCGSCERHVERALEGAGAGDAHADYRRSEAVFTANSRADLSVFARAVAEADYEPGPMEVLDPSASGGAPAPAKAAESAPTRPARSAAGARVACPSCGQVGKPVDIETVKALLAVPLTELRDVPYRFCRTADCLTVYYSADGEQEFREGDLREWVHQKHPLREDVFVCYCFRHTPGSIRAELEAAGRSTVVERVTAGVQAEQCACEIRNPQGSCCLGNVMATVKRVQATARSAPAAAAG